MALMPVHAPVAAALHAAAGLPECWTASAFAELLAMHGVEGRLAVTGADEPAGLVLWRTVFDEAEILTICVHPARRRQGAGRLLLDHAMAEMRKAAALRLFLEVACDNAAAIALYARVGFRPEGRRRNYYRTDRGDVDALIMIADL